MEVSLVPVVLHCGVLCYVLCNDILPLCCAVLCPAPVCCLQAVMEQFKRVLERFMPAEPGSEEGDAADAADGDAAARGAGEAAAAGAASDADSDEDGECVYLCVSTLGVLVCVCGCVCVGGGGSTSDRCSSYSGVQQ
jgi:hypothetical protein